MIGKFEMTGIENISVHDLPVYLSDYLKNNHGIIFCFTTGNSGTGDDGVNSFNLDYYAGGDEKNTRKNRDMILKKLELKKMRKIYSVKQVHGTNILNIDKNTDLESDNIMKEADCLVTDLKDTPIMVMGADCNLILVADLNKKVIAAVHAGWKGTLQGLAAKVISYMKKNFGSKSKDIIVAFGPSIRKCCYRIGNGILERFADKFGPGSFFTKKNNDIYLDLVKLNHIQLEKSGIYEENIFDCGKCTCCNENFFSYRRNKTAGRQAGIAIIV